MDFHRPVCRSNKIQGEILETFQHSLLSKNHFKCLTLAQFFTPFPLKIWKEVLHEYCKRQPAKNCRQSELGSLFPLVKPAREKKGKQQRFLKVAFYSVLSAAGWKIQNNDQKIFFSWKFNVQMSSYLIFLAINPPAERYKFLSCKEMLRDSTTALESRELNLSQELDGCSSSNLHA